MTEKILVEHLVKKYGDNTVLNDINVSINEGDVVCVIGPSGSGKSTFLTIAAGLQIKIRTSTKSVNISAWFSNISICFHIYLF